MIDLFAEFTVIVRGFNRRRIPCAVIGGVALAVYARPRFTDDIDFLADEQRFPVAQRVLEDLRYDETAQPGTFRDSGATQHRFMKVAGRDSLVVDVQTGGSRCGGILRRSLRVRWSKGIVRVAAPGDLVWMKRQRNSEQDQVDIRNLLHDTSRKSHQESE